MPNWLFHVVGDLLLIGAIKLFDKQALKSKKELLELSLLIFSSNFIDIDHLLATPIYDPLRCSINFHPLHSWYMFPVYVTGVFVKNKKIRYVSIAIILHLVLDLLDCYW